MNTLLKSSAGGRLLDKLAGLVQQARELAGREDRMSLWRAYVAIEYAILDVKMRHGLEGEARPAKPKKPDLQQARAMLEKIDLAAADRKKLLYDLRACRDVLKVLVAAYDRRSTTS
jgi:hypothetical protein